MDKRAAKWIIGLEVTGFLMVMGIIWADELLDLPHNLLNAPASQPNVVEGLLESGLVLMLGVLVVILTLVMIARIRELQAFIHVCAWCKKLNIDDSWISFEKYLEEYQGTRSSHGICPDCYQQFKKRQGMD